MSVSRAFRTKFHELSRRKRLIEDRDKVIAAVSGGVDSMVLLDVLAQVQEEFGLMLIVAHFNFMLRGAESDGDEQFVAQRARHYGFELYVERANAAYHAKQNGVSMQEAARNLRYEFFDKLLLSSGFDKIATAHNANDNAETMLLNLFRGAGVAGLSGIPPFREDRRITRPLLFAERSEIEAYAAEEKIPFRSDSSNEQDHYTRNFLRHKVLPLVKEHVNPAVVATVSRSAEIFRELETYLRATAKQHYDDVVAADSNRALQLSTPKLKLLPKLIQQYVVMRAAELFAGARLDFDQVHQILDLTEGLTGSWVPINKENVVFRDRDHLVFRRADEIPEFRFTVLPNHQYTFERFSFSSQLVAANGIVTNGKDAEYVDADALGAPELILRSWKEGDTFVPLGMSSAKKLSDFFIDTKVAIYDKRAVPILTTKTGDIVWICGYRLDERFKITNETKRALRLSFSTTDAEHGTQ
jgi:tRNA(Ile)-lysidine synthase